MANDATRKIGDYEVIDDQLIVPGKDVYLKARKDGREYFLKEYGDPTRPAADVCRPEEFQRRNKMCEDFERKRKTINKIIQKFGGGNFVAPVEFFQFEHRYYQSTLWRQLESMTLTEISQLSDEDKLLLLKTAAGSLKLLHEQGIVHCDIKPANIPVTRVASGRLTCSLMDFDSAELENDISPPEEVYGTDTYWSPELASYKLRRRYYGDYKFTVKSDVFPMAMIFHEYWSGERFSYQQSPRGPYLYNAVIESIPVEVSHKIPQWLETLLRKMINVDPDERPSMGEVLEYLKRVDLKAQCVTPQQVVSDTNDGEIPKPKSLHVSAKPVDFEEEGVGRFCKGPQFPEEAIAFEVLPNGKVVFVCGDGSGMTYSLEIAIRKQYIIEQSEG